MRACVLVCLRVQCANSRSKDPSHCAPSGYELRLRAPYENFVPSRFTNFSTNGPKITQLVTLKARVSSARARCFFFAKRKPAAGSVLMTRVFQSETFGRLIDAAGGR